MRSPLIKVDDPEWSEFEAKLSEKAKMPENASTPVLFPG